MTVGQNIRKKRNENNLTQKDLAEKLNVTPQAVSRWEADEVEPSIDTLKLLAAIFACTLDELLGLSSGKEIQAEPQIVEVEKIVYQEPKKALATCSRCGKIIYETKDLFKVEYQEWHYIGRSSRSEIKTMVLCKSCKEKRDAEIKKQKETKEKERKRKIYRQRVHAIVWPSLFLAIALGISIAMFVQGNTGSGIGFIVGGIIFFPFLATMIMDNTFLTETWMEIAGFGFVKMPGIIFSLSFDGIVWLIAVKILFVIIAFLLALATIVFATAICMVLGIFVYPLSLYRSIHYINPNEY